MSEQGEVVEVAATEPVEAEVQEVQQPEIEEQEVKQETAEQPLPKGVQKRIDRAVRQKYEAEARAKMLEERLSFLERQVVPPQQTQRQADDSEPTIDKFENFDDYVRAKAEYIASRKIQETFAEREKRAAAEREQAERTKTAEGWNRRLAEATAEMPDFEDVLSSSDVPMTTVMQQAIMESDIGPRVAYYLAQNPKEAIDLTRMSAVAQIRAIGRIEAKLEAAAPTKVSSAPAPVKTVGGRATAKVDPDKMSTDEWLRWRNEQVKKRA